MDSGRSPSIIARTQFAYGGNITARGGYAKTRPGFQKVTLSGATSCLTSKFQGVDFFDYSNGQLVMVAGGNTYTISPPVSGSTWTITDVTGTNTLSTTRERVHMVQANDYQSGVSKSYMIIQDGSSTPFILDGGTSRYATSQEVPTGTGPMAFGQGRLWVAKGRNFMAGDIMGGSNGVLKFTENAHLAGGGAFAVPLSAGAITAMRFVAAPNTALGQGELLVFTSDAVTSVQVPVDRHEWYAVKDPLQRVLLIHNGAMGHFSTELVNGDVFMRSRDGIRSVVQAVRDFNQLGNTPISSEMHRVMKHDLPDYLQYASGVLFDNRYLLTTQAEKDDGDVVFKGLIALDFDLISSMKGKLPPAYDGFWRLDIQRESTAHHMRICQLVKGRFYGVERCFAFVRNASGDTEMWELTADETADIDVDSSGTKTRNKVASELETPSLDFQKAGASKTLEGADLWVDELTGGTTTFHADFHPDQYPCWVSWQDWCVTAESVSSDCDSLVDYKQQYRPRMRIGRPPDTEEPAVGKPFNYGWEFAARLKWTGHARVKLFRLNARETEEEPYADVDIDCGAKAIACDCLSGVSSATDQ